MTHYLNPFWIFYAHNQVILNPLFAERDKDEIATIEFPEFNRPMARHDEEGYEYTIGGLPDYAHTDIDGRDVEGMKLL